MFTEKRFQLKKNVYKQKKFDIVISPKLCSPGYDVLFLGSYLCHLKEFIFIDNFNHMTFSTLNIWRCKMLDTLIGAVYKHHTYLIPAGARLSNMIIKYPLENFHGFFSFFYRCSIWIWKLFSWIAYLIWRINHLRYLFAPFPPFFWFICNFAFWYTPYQHHFETFLNSLFY